MKSASLFTAFKVWFVLQFYSSQRICQCLERLHYTSLLPFSESSFDFDRVCFKHTDCPPGLFCSIAGQLDDYYGKWLTYGECSPCEKCSCDEVAIDGVCPLSKCVNGQSAMVNRLAGTFYNVQRFKDNLNCFTAFSFEGQTFRQMSFILTADLLHSNLPQLVSDEDTVLVEASQCSEIHGGLKGGTFSVDDQNTAHLTYTDGYNYYRNSSLVLNAQFSFACPNLRVLLDRTPIPTFIYHDPLHPVSANGYNAVADALLNPCGTRAIGLCLSPHLLPAREALSLILRPTGPGVDRVFRGQIALNAWRSTALAQPYYFPNGSSCTVDVEQAGDGRLVYFRIHTYGCVVAGNTPPVPAAVTTSGTSRAAATTGASAPTTSLPPLPPITTSHRVTTPRPSTVTTSRPPLTFPPSTPCRGFADLNASSSSPAGAGVPVVLDCDDGAINLLQYPPETNRSWRVGRAGRDVVIRFASAAGLRPRQDYVRLTPPPPAPPVYLSGAETDPAPGVRVRVCLAVLTCADGRSEDLGQLSLRLSGPVLVNMLSGLGPGAGGTILIYAVETLSPVRWSGGGAVGSAAELRSRAGRSLTESGDAWEKRVGRAVVSRQISDPADTFPAEGCPCLVGPSPNAPPAPACGSPFFSDAMCAPSVATWPWLAFHSIAAVTVGSGPPVAVDAVLYFERFSNLGSQNRLYATAVYKLFTPGLAHVRDVIALYKGRDDDAGACDARRTLATCTHSSPLASPPTLNRQLCWAYSSAAAGPDGLWSDPHVPGPVAAQSGSVNFCNDVAESAGNGTYYALLYSYTLKRVVAQVDYIQERDCKCRNSTTGEPAFCEGATPFPCLPWLLPNPQRRYDYSGPLALCQVMTYRGADGLCTACPSGKYSDMLNAAACVTCQHTTYLTIAASGLPLCTPCPPFFTTDIVVNALCGLLLNVSRPMQSATTTAIPRTAARVDVTSTQAFCGDGYIKQTPMGVEQCDSGWLSRSWNVSTSISVFDTNLPSAILGQFPVLFRVCDVNCMVQQEQCGNGVVFQGPTPIYALDDCLVLNGLAGSGPIPLYVCSKPYRKDNLSVVYMEECDDGNEVSGDGCSSACRIERLWDCVTTENVDVCTYLCQNGRVNTSTGEECDDGNSVDGDGCSRDCKIECGFQCRVYEPEGQSVCGSICGDGIISSIEACDIGLVKPSPDNPYGRGCSSACQIEQGWECSKVAKCFEANYRKQAQVCNPVCGDGAVIFPEECDDGDWNLFDKACTPKCRFNRDYICYGANCSFAEARAQSVEDALTGSLVNVDRMAEGIWFLVENQDLNIGQTNIFPVLSMFSTRSSAQPKIFPTYVDEHASLQGAAATSLALKCPVCSRAEETVLKAAGGVIAEHWALLANDVFCNLKFRPDDENIVIQLTISELLINVEAACTNCVYLELTTSLYNAPGKSVRRFNRSASILDPLFLIAPADITIFGKHLASTYNTNQSLFRMSINFTALSLSHDKLLCLSKCAWNSSCTKNCINFNWNKVANYMSNSNVNMHQYSSEQSMARNREESVSNATSDCTAMEESDFSRRNYLKGSVIAKILVIGNQPADTSVLTAPQKIKYPCSFSQRPSPSGSLLIPVQRKESFTDPRFTGSWRGSCYAVYSSSLPSVLCTVTVYIAQDSIIKHITDCPLRGTSVGRVISMDFDIATATDAGFNLVFFKRAVITWTSSSTLVNSVNRNYLSIFAFTLEPDGFDFRIQILLEGAMQTDLSRPKFLQDGKLADESNCRLIELRRMKDTTSLRRQFESRPATNDEDKFITCNRSLASAILKLQNSSFDCLLLLKAFVFRDFWLPMNVKVEVLNSTFDYEPLESFTCKSKCLKFFKSELNRSLDICHSLWNTQWTKFEIGIRLFKLLMSVSSAMFWSTIICSSNHRNESCAFLLSAPQSWFPENGGRCPLLLNQSIFGPLFGENQSFCGQCLLELESYVNSLGCCAETVEEAGMLWLKVLSNRELASISVNLGDRSNPFNTSFLLDSSGLDQVHVILNNNLSTIGLFNSKLEVKANVQGFVTVHDALSTCGKGCLWPVNNQKCCNGVNCARGFKSYPGSCACVCPEGYGGPVCDFQGFYVETVLKFPGETLFGTFSSCDIAGLTQLFAMRVGLQSVALDIILLPSATMPSSEKQRDLQVTDVDLMVRLSLLACDSTARMTQILSSLFSKDISNLFNSSNLPSPKVITISSYCSGVKTECGWKGTPQSDGTVDLVAVSALCAPKTSNSSIPTATTNAMDTQPQVQWRQAIIATASCLGFAAILGAFLYLRKKVPNFKVWNFPQASKLFGVFTHSGGKVSSNSVLFDISFDKCTAMKTPNTILISNSYNPGEDFEIVYKNEYESSDRALHSEFDFSVLSDTFDSTYQLSKSRDSEDLNFAANASSPSQQITSRSLYSHEFDINFNSAPASSRSLQISSRIMYSDDLDSARMSARAPLRQITSRDHSKEFDTMNPPTLTNSQSYQISSQFSYSHNAGNVVERQSLGKRHSLISHQLYPHGTAKEIPDAPLQLAARPPICHIDIQNHDQPRRFATQSIAGNSLFDDVEIRRVPQWSAFEPP